jgi:hypothetical protein
MKEQVNPFEVRMDTQILGLSPMSLSSMQQCKVEEDNRQYKKCIKDIITTFYTEAIEAAKTGSSYKCRSDPRYLAHLAGLRPTEFIVRDDTLTEILGTLRELFPGCRLTHSKMAKGINGKMHDISQMDELTTKLIATSVIDIRQTEEYIVLDWSTRL